MPKSFEMPVLAVRGRVIFPGTVATFDVGRLKSLSAIKLANDERSGVFIVSQLEASNEEVSPDGIYRVGTIAGIRQISRLPGSNIRITVEGRIRAVLVNCYEKSDSLYGEVDTLPSEHGDKQLEEAYLRVVRSAVHDVAAADSRFSKEAVNEIDVNDDADAVSFIAANAVNAPYPAKQEILETSDIPTRLNSLVALLRDEVEIAALEKKITAAVRQNIEKNQKEYYLREQLRAIHSELGDDPEERDELEEKIKNSGMPDEAREKALKELSRMTRMQTSSPDYNVLRIYLDWMLDLPWNVYTEDTEKLSDAVKILNDDHYGLEKIKERITEYLAVLKRTGGMNAPILCFVGPPGVGKTSIAGSIARALNRKFVRMSLGGVKDEAEIRGHRKTYIGAMPGRIIAGIKRAGSSNPVFLLDEVDKISMDMRGDPADALLEVLDPAQNSTFVDRYIEVAYDLSKVLFVTTANSLETIPAPLRDRMEIIELNGYTQEEKLQIAKRYLVPKKREANGLKEAEVCFNEGALNEIISGYTLEAGVRSLERRIDAVCRKVAVKLSDGKCKKVRVTEKNVSEFLGRRRFEKEELTGKDSVGAATGLAWTAYGGVTLTIEVSAMHGKGEVLLTGKLGDVMKESARAAISYIRSNCAAYGVESSAFENTDIHIHVPEGATPKDGPSAGITMACAILSAFTGKPVKANVAMTGEITLRGKVLPIGGLKEKALAAYRTGIRDVIIPADNQKDLEDIPEQVRGEINFIPVTEVDSVFRTAIIGL